MRVVTVLGSVVILLTSNRMKYFAYNLFEGYDFLFVQKYISNLLLMCFIVVWRGYSIRPWHPTFCFDTNWGGGGGRRGRWYNENGSNSFPFCSVIVDASTSSSSEVIIRQGKMRTCWLETASCWSPCAELHLRQSEAHVPGGKRS